MFSLNSAKIFVMIVKGLEPARDSPLVLETRMLPQHQQDTYGDMFKPNSCFSDLCLSECTSVLLQLGKNSIISQCTFIQNSISQVFWIWTWTYQSSFFVISLYAKVGTLVSAVLASEELKFHNKSWLGTLPQQYQLISNKKMIYGFQLNFSMKTSVCIFLELF